ncbi:MAG: hypothetical protein WC785_02425 [Tatlockia sp.]|jgi:hypothetical protein
MPRAVVYYYPAGFGHIGVNIQFSRNEVPHQEYYGLLVHSRDNTPQYEEQHLKLYARTHYYPVLFLQENGEYSIYGNKDGFWQETPLTNLSLSQEEHNLLQKLPFYPVRIQENDKYFLGRYQGEQWQKKPCSKFVYINERDYQVTKITAGSLFNLIQQGHTDFNRTEYFFDWGAAYDFEENRIKRGEPIRIPLPPTTKSFTDFFSAVVKDDYSGFTPSDYPTYRLLTNNCAHATMEILHCAGYMPNKPKRFFGLAPITAAKKASELARQSQAIFRKRLLEAASETDPKELVNTLIELSINRLNRNIHFNYGKHLGGCARELEKLSLIKYDGSYESIERLLKTSEEVTPHTARELEDCIALVDPNACLQAGIARLNLVAQELKNKKNASRLQAIAAQLTVNFNEFKEKKLSNEEFTRICANLIDEASPILKQEGGVLKQVIKNIALAVCGLVALYLVAGFINNKNTGNFMFFNKPSLLKIGTDIKDNANRLVDKAHQQRREQQEVSGSMSLSCT